MSYLVCHVQKFKANDVGGIQRHNQRETEGHKNKDIDNDKSHLNYDLHLDHDLSYKNEIKDILDKNYTGKKAIRKDAVVMTSTVISSDKAFFDRLGKEETKRFFEESYNKLKDIYGENNIISARIHMDETTPHMHLTAVPITQEGKLSAKECISRENLRRLQNEIPKYLQEKGFAIERGVENSQNKHIEVHEFKKQVLEKLNIELERDVKELEDIKSSLDSIKSIDYKKVPLSNVVTLKKQDFEKLSDMAQKGIEYKQKNASLVVDIRYLESDNKHLNKTASLQCERANRAIEQNTILKKNHDKLKLKTEAMYKTLDRYDLLSTAQKFFDEIRKNHEPFKTKSKSKGFERSRERER